MATYTNVEVFKRDYFPTGADSVMPRIIERAAEMAYNRINSRLSRVYSTPFATVPPEIVTISDMLTKCYALSLQSGRSPVMVKPGKDDAPDGACALAEQWLDELVAGKAELTGVSPTTGARAFYTHAGHTPIFAVDNSVNHQPDPDLLDEIERKRES